MQKNVDNSISYFGNGCWKCSEAEGYMEDSLENKIDFNIMLTIQTTFLLSFQFHVFPETIVQIDKVQY